MRIDGIALADYIIPRRDDLRKTLVRHLPYAQPTLWLARRQRSARTGVRREWQRWAIRGSPRFSALPELPRPTGTRAVAAAEQCGLSSAAPDAAGAHRARDAPRHLPCDTGAEVEAVALQSRGRGYEQGRSSARPVRPQALGAGYRLGRRAHAIAHLVEHAVGESRFASVGGAFGSGQLPESVCAMALAWMGAAPKAVMTGRLSA